MHAPLPYQALSARHGLNFKKHASHVSLSLACCTHFFPLQDCHVIARQELTGSLLAVARHKSLDVTPVKTTGAKSVGMTVAEVADVIREDFEKRQYYVTGRLSKRIYSDDCFFDAPDPDMPVKGLRKYVDAISHLFEQKSSKVELISMQELPNRRAIIARCVIPHLTCHRVRATLT